MNVVYFETNHRNGLIFISNTHEVKKIKSNKMLFNSRDWIIFYTIRGIISSTV